METAVKKAINGLLADRPGNDTLGMNPLPQKPSEIPEEAFHEDSGVGEYTFQTPPANRSQHMNSGNSDDFPFTLW